MCCWCISGLFLIEVQYKCFSECLSCGTKFNISVVFTLKGKITDSCFYMQCRWLSQAQSEAKEMYTYDDHMFLYQFMCKLETLVPETRITMVQSQVSKWRQKRSFGDTDKRYWRRICVITVQMFTWIKSYLHFNKIPHSIMFISMSRNLHKLRF